MKKTISIFYAMILVMGIFAFSWGLGEVSGQVSLPTRWTDSSRAMNNQGNQKAQYINQIMINGYYDGWKRISGSKGFFGIFDSKSEKETYWEKDDQKISDTQMLNRLYEANTTALKIAAMTDSNGNYRIGASASYGESQGINPLFYYSMFGRGNMNNPFLMGQMMSGANTPEGMAALMMMNYNEEEDYTHMLPMILAMSGQVDQNSINTMMAGQQLGKQGVPKINALGQILMMSLKKGGGINFEAMGLGLAMYALTYREYEKEIIKFSCNAWEAPLGGANCDKCNSEEMPCDEYQCRSLGQACRLENKGTDEAICYNAFRGDAKPPAIEPWEDVLSEGYRYKETSSGEERSYQIIYEDNQDGCVPAFTPLRFGVTADEPAKCKIDYLRKQKFEDMEYYVGGSSSFKYNHSEILSIPGPGEFNVTEENAEIFNDGNWRLYLRCSDPNGNYNVKNLVFEFCVDEGPDVTAPEILTTSLLNGMAVAYEQESIGIDVYTDELADCKWDFQDEEYEDMEHTMECVDGELEFNTFMMYKCSTTLTGIQDRVENNYYFKCEDKEGNANRESYEFSLIGTEPLLIDSVEPEEGEVIRGSSNRIKVTLEAETSAGYNEGEATCYFSETGETSDYVMFYYEQGMSSYKHEQELWLPEGEYNYFIKCIDLGGNIDFEEVGFSVESDTTSPSVVRVYFEEGYLKLITNEIAECVYSKESCNYAYDDGIKMSAVEDTEHFTEWNTNFNYYVKCKDEYENRPIQNECSIIVRPSSLY